MSRVWLTRQGIVDESLAIAREYRGIGLTLTLRQLYYQLVSRDLLDNGQKHYKRVGATLTDARYAGTFPVEYIEDRGRTVDPGAFTRNDMSVIQALDTAEQWLPNLPGVLLDRHRWFDQPVHVSVWVEKEALAGVFAPVCEELGVSWFACKGYPSVSALKNWLDLTDLACHGSQRWRYNYGPRWGEKLEAVERREGRAKRAVVLYFGDHDPDGWEIPRSAERNLAKLRAVQHLEYGREQARAYGWSGDEDDFDEEARTRAVDYPKELKYPIEFKRIALNMDQIREYDPPPFEAKVTSARYAGYVEEHQTRDAWELDALEPSVLRALIRAEVEDLFDPSIHQRNRQLVEHRRLQMRENMTAEWAATALDDA